MDRLEEQQEDPFLGELLCERYRVVSLIGRGGMGIVYQGTHVSLGKRVAIKRLDHALARDPAAFERFRGEAIAASRVESPHVVQVFDWGKSADGSPFIVMELLEGRNLREYLELEGRLVPAEAAHIASQMLSGLSRIHQAQILHRDIKPENVFLCAYDGGTSFVKLLDFGISKRQAPEDSAAAHSTKSGVILGTALYMSPEQAKGELSLDARTDLYSVGAVLFEMLTGQPPHPGRTYEGILVDICTRDADDIRLHCPLLPDALALTVARALKRERAERITSCSEFQRALFEALPELEQEPKFPSSHPAKPTSVLGSLPTLPSSDPVGLRANPRLSNDADDLRRGGSKRAEPELLDVQAEPATYVDSPRSMRFSRALGLTMAGVVLSAVAVVVMLRSGPGARANGPILPPGSSVVRAESTSGGNAPAILTSSEGRRAPLQGVADLPGPSTLAPRAPAAVAATESTPRVPPEGATNTAKSTSSTAPKSRPGIPTTAPVAPNASAGVLGGLKLRRSMP